MKITLEPTEKDREHPTVTIAFDSDHLNLSEVVDELLIPALVCWGFPMTTIRENLTFTAR